MANNTTNSSLICPPHIDYDSLRFALIVIGGTPLATIGVFTNTMLLILFMQSKYRNSPTLYLGFLALLDVAICAMYWCIFTVDALAYYYQINSMYHAWHLYAMEMYAASKIVQFASTYLVVCATLERYLLVSEMTAFKVLYSSNARKAIILIVIILSLGLRLPSFWEYTIKYKTECGDPFDGVYEFHPVLAIKESYIFFNFYVLQVIRVFIPFTLLISLNVAVIYHLRKKLQIQRTRTLLRESVLCTIAAAENKNTLIQTGLLWDLCNTMETRFIDDTPVETTLDPVPMKKRKSSGVFFGAVNYRASRNRLKAATLTMIAIVTTYLMCNSLDLFVKFIERVGPVPLLHDEEQTPTTFYTYSTDFISILFCFNSFCRIFIYSACDPELREALRRKFCQRPEEILSLSSRRNSSRREKKIPQTQEINSNVAPVIKMLNENQCNWTGEQEDLSSPMNPLISTPDDNYGSSSGKTHQRNGLNTGYNVIIGDTTPRTEETVYESFV